MAYHTSTAKLHTYIINLPHQWALVEKLLEVEETKVPHHILRTRDPTYAGEPAEESTLLQADYEGW
jgi:hypothetical protein